MKQFFKMMFASALGVFVATGLILTVLIFVVIGIAGSMSDSSEYKPKSDTVFKLSLSGTLSDNVQENPFSMLMGDEEKKLSLKDILFAINQAKANSNVKGIYIQSGALQAGSSSLSAIRCALADFKKSGKFVVAYSDGYTQGGYYLCSMADKVFLNPMGMVGLAGMASQTLFLKGLLSKLGVEMMIFKVGTYKGAVEPFMLDKLSDANREQIQSYMNSIWGNVIAGIAEGRKMSTDDVNRFVNEGFAFSGAEKALEQHFVDELKYEPEVEEYVKELAGQKDSKLKTASLDQLKNIKEKTGSSKNEIAILYAEGEITSDEFSTPYETGQLITEEIARELIKLKNNDAVKAVVLRVNSPGGSAYVSEQIWRQVVEVKKVKPIVVSMGDVAASGGYYISCAASKIVAEPNTLTGSIGVFGMFPNATNLFGKLSLTTDVVKTNTYADLGDISRPMREDEKMLIQANVERTYGTFLTRCADGRKMSKDAVNEIAQGRVWTGDQAKERGLVDELGGIEKAITIAAGLAEVKDYCVTNVPGSKDFFQKFMEKELDDIRMSVVKSVLGTDYTYFQTLNRIRSTAGVQARLPYDINPL